MARLLLGSRRFALSAIVGMIALHLLGCRRDPPPQGGSSAFEKAKQKRMEIIRKEYRGDAPAPR
jgi:hypothetical protein